MAKRSVFTLARTFHAWSGIVLCAVLMVISITGSLLVFKDDYLRATLPEAREAPDLTTSGLARVTESVEAAFPIEELRALVYAEPDLGLHKVYLTEGRSAYVTSQGDVLDTWEPNGRFEDWLFDLHHRLLAGNIGVWIAGLSGLAAAGLVIGGVIAFWPARRGIKRGLKVTKASRTQLLSLHRNLGVYSALPIMLLALSGTALSFPETSRALFDRFGGPKAPPNVHAAPGDIDWSSALQSGQALFPKAEPRIAIWPGSEGPATLRLKTAGEWHPNGRTVVAINPADASVLYAKDANTEGSGRRAFNAIYPIHAAHVGGWVYDTIVFVSGLSLFLLGFVGATTFWRRWK